MPAGEVETLCGNGTDADGHIGGIGATAIDHTHSFGDGFHRDGVGRERLEDGCENHRVGDRHKAGIVGVAVVPADEAGAVGRCGADFDNRAFGIGAFARHCAPLGIVGNHLEGILLCAGVVEEGLVGGVLCHCDVSRVADDAVAPADEGVVFERTGVNHSRFAVVVDAAAFHGATFSGFTTRCDFVLEG